MWVKTGIIEYMSNTEFLPEQTIYFYNKWSDFENQEINKCFISLLGSEVEILKIGDLVWVNDEPYDPKGKVYGYTAHVLDKIEINGQDFKLYFKNSTTSFQLWPDLPVYKIKDSENLKKLIENNPKSLIF